MLNVTSLLSPFWHERAGQAMQLFSTIRSPPESHGSCGWGWSSQCNEMDLDSELTAPRTFPSKEYPHTWKLSEVRGWSDRAGVRTPMADSLYLTHCQGKEQRSNCRNTNLEPKFCTSKKGALQRAAIKMSYVQGAFWIQAVALGLLYVIKLRKFQRKSIYSISCHG